MKALVIARTNLRRLFRERSTLFFVFVLPLLIVLLLGATFGGTFTPRLGVAVTGAGPLGDELVAALDRSGRVEIERYGSEDGLVQAVERGNVQGGLVVPPGYDRDLRTGGTATLAYLARPDELGQQLRAVLQAVVTEQVTLLRAARFAQAEASVPFDRGLELAEAVSPRVSPVSVEARVAGEATFPEELGQFDLGASTELVLFVFLTSLTGAVALIETRRLGVSRRMLSTPTSARTILAGEALGRFGVALVQGVFIMVGTLLLFRVSFGDPLGAILVLVVFCLVGTGAGMLLGSTLANDQQAGATSLLLGLGLAALGGCMAPLEIFPDTVRTVAHVTPHAWANDAFAKLVRRGGGVVDVLPQLAVLAGYAAVLLGLATWRLRRALT